jgi:hypothetical protein
VQRLVEFQAIHCRSIRTFFLTSLLLLVPATVDQVRAQGGAGAPARPIPELNPEARPDTAVTEVDRSTRIEVLENDINIPSQPRPELRIERSPACGTAEVDGTAVIFKGGPQCVGVDVSFGYSVQLPNGQVRGLVSVKVKPAAAVAVPCDVPGYEWGMTKIEGGTFDKASAPPNVIDFVDLIDENTFSVRPFCITVEAVPAEPVGIYFDNIREEDRRDRFPELQQQSSAIAPGQDVTGRASARVSQRMALAFASRVGEKSSRKLMLPSLEQYVAVAWELQTRRPGAPETDAFIVMMRSGSLQWTSTPCGSGSYWTVGPSTQGRLVKLCYEQSRLDRTGFRLAIQ